MWRNIIQRKEGIYINVIKIEKKLINQGNMEFFNVFLFCHDFSSFGLLLYI